MTEMTEKCHKKFSQSKRKQIKGRIFVESLEVCTVGNCGCVLTLLETVYRDVALIVVSLLWNSNWPYMTMNCFFLLKAAPSNHHSDLTIVRLNHAQIPTSTSNTESQFLPKLIHMQHSDLDDPKSYENENK